MTIKTSQPTKTLQSEGFIPNTNVEQPRKVAGCWKSWSHADGRKALVGYGLFSRTGQSSIGSAAIWGYTIQIDEAGR